MRTAAPAPFLPTLAELAAAAREKLAAELFAVETVRAAMTDAACAGRERLFLRPATPLDLRQTAAATALLAHLAEVGAAVFWHAYTAEREGRAETGHELEITWHGPR